MQQHTHCQSDKYEADSIKTKTKKRRDISSYAKSDFKELKALTVPGHVTSNETSYTLLLMLINTF
jgi:hypothetical protein